MLLSTNTFLRFIIYIAKSTNVVNIMDYVNLQEWSKKLESPLQKPFFAMIAKLRLPLLIRKVTKHLSEVKLK